MSAHDPELEVAVFPEDGYGIVQPVGPVEAKDIVALSLGLVAHPSWRPGFTEVWDTRFSGAIDIVPGDVPSVLELERQTKAALDGSTTLVVTNRPLLLYSAKFYARLVKPLGRTVVAAESAREAAECLGIDALPDLRSR